MRLLSGIYLITSFKDLSQTVFLSFGVIHWKHMYQHGFSIYNQSCVSVSIYQEIISIKTNGDIGTGHDWKTYDGFLFAILIMIIFIDSR